MRLVVRNPNYYIAITLLLIGIGYDVMLRIWQYRCLLVSFPDWLISSAISACFVVMPIVSVSINLCWAYYCITMMSISWEANWSSYGSSTCRHAYCFCKSQFVLSILLHHCVSVSWAAGWFSYGSSTFRHAYCFCKSQFVLSILLHHWVSVSWAAGWSNYGSSTCRHAYYFCKYQAMCILACLLVKYWLDDNFLSIYIKWNIYIAA